MLIDHDWEPGVWINGRLSTIGDAADAFSTFAHHVHDDLLAARDAGRIPAHCEITVSASTVCPLWSSGPGDIPPVTLLYVRFTGLCEPQHAPTRNQVTAEAFASLDRRGTELLRPDQFDHYTGTLCFVDEHNTPQDTRKHKPPPH